MQLQERLTMYFVKDVSKGFGNVKKTTNRIAFVALLLEHCYTNALSSKVSYSNAFSKPRCTIIFS